eukprot:2794892-Rhodomonas_salina.1
MEGGRVGWRAGVADSTPHRAQRRAGAHTGTLAVLEPSLSLCRCEDHCERERKARQLWCRFHWLRATAAQQNAHDRHSDCVAWVSLCLPVPRPPSLQAYTSFPSACVHA